MMQREPVKQRVRVRNVAKVSAPASGAGQVTPPAKVSVRTPELIGAALVLAIVAVPAYFGLEWTGRLLAGWGTGFTEWLGGSGGGGGVCDTLPDWLCDDFIDRNEGGLSDFSAVGLMLIFVLFLLYLIYTLARLPLRPSWAAHASFYQRVKWSPHVIAIVLVLTNFTGIPTILATLLVNVKVLAAYTAALAGLIYTTLFLWLAPKDAHLLATSVNAPPLNPAIAVSRPSLRYVLAILGYVFAVQSIFLLITTIPAALALYPEGYPWYRAFWPFGS